MRKIYDYIYYCFYALVRNFKSRPGYTYHGMAKNLLSFCFCLLFANSIKFVRVLYKYNLPKSIVLLLILLYLLLPYLSFYFNKRYFIDTMRYRSIRDNFDSNSSKVIAQIISLSIILFSILIFPFWKP
jgi:hypothetical protein